MACVKQLILISILVRRIHACPGNPVCSGHGQCSHNVCVCNTGFNLLDCSGSWFTSNNWAMYTGLRTAVLTVFSLLFALYAWRFVVLAIAKFKWKGAQFMDA